MPVIGRAFARPVGIAGRTLHRVRDTGGIASHFSQDEVSNPHGEEHGKAVRLEPRGQCNAVPLCMIQLKFASGSLRPRIKSDALSAIIMVDALRFAEIIRGMIEASITRKP